MTAFIFPFLFFQAEKLDFGIKITKQRKIDERKLYNHNYKSAMQQEFKKHHESLAYRRKRMKTIHVILLKLKLYKTLIETYPQIIIKISLLFLSFEHQKIQSWILDSLKSAFSTNEYVIGLFFGVSTIGGILRHLQTIRYYNNFFWIQFFTFNALQE